MKKLYKILCLGLAVALLGGANFAPSMAMAKRNKEKSHMMAGEASWYGEDFHGKKTASGPLYDMDKQTAAHRTLPFGTVLEVVDDKTGLRTVVCITDRGPVSRKRCIDLSRSAAMELDLGERGITPVTMRLVGDVEGKIINDKEAFYVQVQKDESSTTEKMGPYTNFADASVMLEVLSKKYSKATIIVSSVE